MNTYCKAAFVFANLLLLFSCGGHSSGQGHASTSMGTSSNYTSSMASVDTSSGASSSAPVVGISVRPSNTTCLAPPPVNITGGSISWPSVFPSLPNIPLAISLIQAPGDNTNWYVLRQPGVIVRFVNESTANTLSEVLNIEDRVQFTGNEGDETGLLGVAFHPQFSTHRYVYLNYTALNGSNSLETRIARYNVLENGNFDRDSEKIILRFNQPYANHNGGQLAFGGDGYLYIATGDGGSGGDPHENGQNTNVLLGKILRIDINNVSTGRNYAIPADNPFATTGGAPEVWAYGLRNPWRFSFDSLTGDMWVGDVGQMTWEEINIVTRGGNYGWGDMEGDSCYSGRSRCSTANKIKPILAVNHSNGSCAIIGGYVYRGSEYPAIYGKYFFSDFCLNTMQSITRQQNGGSTVVAQGNGPVSIVSFAQDNQKELYALGQSGAGTQIVKMQATGGTQQPGVMADHLSATGCVNPSNAQQPAMGMIPFSVQSTLWADGASKERYLSLPDNNYIDLTAAGDFLFPVGSVLMKHFKLNNRFIETRLFVHGVLGWQGFSYEWNDDQTDALLLSDGKDKTVEEVSWHYPSPGQCMTCHTSAANFSLGIEAMQLNSEMIYPYSHINANQLTTLEHINIFSHLLNDTQKSLKLASVNDTAFTVAERARSYLHSNCSGCHRPGSQAPVNLDLQYTTALADTQTCNAAPTAGDLGITDAKIIAPGQPEKSILLARMNTRGENQMPPIGTHIVDTDAVKVVGDWIASLTNCD